MDGRFKGIYRWGFLVILLGLVISSSLPAGTAGAQAPIVGNVGNVFLPALYKDYLPPDESTQRIQVPEGFQIRIFAQGLAGRVR
ncbi:MAG: hypothetical protein ABFD44_04490, partial [Anaerolineaceae bacterium]